MNKNPFVPTPAYTPQQPPLPPGPPPPQPDYSAYWAAASAAQHAQAPATATYNPQWPTPQPAQQARPAPEHSALYANYGYGNQQNHSWQQQQQRQTQPHYQPPPPVAQPPPPPPPQTVAQAYTPFQPQAGAYAQPYVPQAGPVAQSVAHAPFQPAAPVPPVPFQQPQQQFYPQQQQRNNNRNIHPPPQQFPPAKRQRFDGPGPNRGPPPQPQFQPPPPPPPMQPPGPMPSFNLNQGQGPQGGGRGGGPSFNQMRGGYVNNRGGNNAGGRGRGGQMGMNRGGNRGRGGGTYNNMGGRGGGSQSGGQSFRGHGSNRGFGNRDNRRGGSFAQREGQGFSHGFQQHQNQNQNYGHNQHQQYHHSHQHHQQNYTGGSFRGRNQSFTSRGSHHHSGGMHGVKDGSGVVSSSFSSGKKEENRRTLTDFKIVGLEIPELEWSWGALSSTSSETMKAENIEPPLPAESLAAPITDNASASASVKAEGSAGTSDVASAVPAADVSDVPAVAEGSASKSESISPPPSRIRIYFHTPPTPDDARPITSQFVYSPSVSNTRKGKRKKEDDDGDEDGRGPPPPPPGAEHDGANVVSHADYDHALGRDSVAPSVAETASEGDWLMAAIGGDEADGEGEDEHQGDEENYHDAEMGDDNYGDGNGYDETQGDSHGDFSLTGEEDAHGEAAEHYGNGDGGDAPAEPDDAPAEDEASEPPIVPQVNGASISGQSPAKDEVSPGPVAETQPSAPLELPDASGGAVSDSAAPTVLSSAGVADAPGGSVNGSRAQPLQSMASMASTVPDSNAQDPNFVSFATAAEEHPAEGQDAEYEATQPAHEDFSQFESHHPEAPASPAISQTLAPSAYAASATVSESAEPQAFPKLETKTAPSANRLSVSYAAGTRRLVINAEIVEKLKVFRADGRIEVYMVVDKNDSGYKGIIIEGYNEATSSYVPLDITAELEADITVPPFLKIGLPSKMVLKGYLDKDRPLSEPKWVKSGDVQEWLKSMFGRMFWVAGEAADGWERKIEVADPDPPPTIWTVLESWASSSSVGTLTERQRFLRTHMTETDNILEILLRLVRGERATYNQTPPISAPSISGPLLAALSQGSAHGAQQTHVSLAVLAIFRLAVEYAKKAEPQSGKGEVEARAGEIIRCLPSHLLHKSLDGIFKEWKADKKGGKP